MNDQVTKAETEEILRLAEQAINAEGDFVELGCYKGLTSVLLGKLLQSHCPVENFTSTCAKPVEKSHNHVEKFPKTCGKSVDNPTKSVDNLPIVSGKPVENLQANSSPKRLWIYDSFAGLPEKASPDMVGAGANFQAGELFVTKREVVERIRRAGLRNVIIKKAWFNQLQDHDLPSQIAFAFCDGDLYESIKTSLQLVLPRLAHQGIIIVHDYNNPQLPGSAKAVDEFLRGHADFRLQVKHTLAILSRK